MQEESPDVVYLDVIVSNLNNGDLATNPTTYAEYNETRTIPYLYDPCHYFGAVVQFNLDNTDTPILVAPIVPNQSNANLTIYTVGMTYSGTTVTAPVIFIPQNSLTPAPLPPSGYPDGLQDNNTDYYNLYSYAYMTQLVNTALDNALNQLKALFPAIPSATASPFLKYDPVTQLFSIAVDNSLFNQDNSTPFITILFNNPLYYLYYSFSAWRIDLNNYIFFPIRLNINTGMIDTATNTLVSTQERNSTNLWAQISSLVITSNTVPIVRSQTFSPGIYYSGAVVPALNNSLTQSILLEYSVDDSIYTRNIVYNPTAQYKIFCLNSEYPLYNLDLKFWYRSTTGLLRPIALNSGASMSVKIGFFKKSKFQMLKQSNY